MKVLLTAVEAIPFAKTGNLSEITGTLPLYLKDLGIDVRIIMPFHSSVTKTKVNFQDLGRITATINDKNINGFIKQTEHEGIIYYFVQHDDYFFNREGIYQYSTEDGIFKDYKDNLQRFAYFSMSVLESMHITGFFPDVIHCHAWHTALIPIYLKILYSHKKQFSSIKTLFTIHNMAFQGLFPSEDFIHTGLPRDIFTPDFLEYYGMLNLLKGGLTFSDFINTVSETYASEIQREKLGCGLEGVLKKRKKSLRGIQEGIDYNVWNPETDPYTYKINFSSKNPANKKEIKKKLLKEFSLDSSNPDRPLFILTSKLEAHKGMALLEEIINKFLNRDLSLIVLNTGSKRYVNLFKKMAEHYPDRMAFSENTEESTLHKVIAGADILLMPSEYEPGGLYQQYALRYGTVPIVHGTGGLADTVEDNINGFIFWKYTSEDFFTSIKKAINLYKNKKEWKKIQIKGMEQDWSWTTSAKKYKNLFKNLIKT